MDARVATPATSSGVGLTLAEEARGGRVEFQTVRKAYAGRTVLNGLSFLVQAGEKLAVIGPSGSGKTTILRLLATLDRPDAGEILIDGEPLWSEQRGEQRLPAGEKHLHHMREKIGMVFQLFNLFPNMTVIDNITLAPVLTRRMQRDEAIERARGLLQKVGLSDKENAWPDTLSGGQKQRVAIARALALEPRIMLFDEITSALDPELVEEVLNVIQSISRDRAMTMILVTHEMGFARDFADRVMFMDGGTVVEEGPPEAIFGRPSHERTRTFLKKIIAAGYDLSPGGPV
jgi:polar amino acid transport system ATP-binding protein